VKEIPLRDRIVAALKPREENQRAERILLSDWTLAAVKQREEDRRWHERKEKQRAKETFVSNSLIAFKQKEEERREKQKEEKRRKEELAPDAAVATMKQAQIAEAKILDEQAEATRRAKDKWREREEAEFVLRALDDARQRAREETRAVPKSWAVRSRGTARMTRGVLSTLTTVTIAGAIGFGAGVYVTPPDKADEFRALVNRASITPEAASKKIQSAVPSEPATGAPAADTTGQKNLPDATANAPSTTPIEKSDSPTSPAPSAEPVAPLTRATPATATNAENVVQPKLVAKRAPIAKPHPKPPVKKPKPKPKPTEHHPEAAPAEQTPAADEPAQQ
jgi:hypothetical protein